MKEQAIVETLSSSYVSQLNRRSFLLDFGIGSLLTIFSVIAGHSFLSYLWPPRQSADEVGGSSQTFSAAEVPVGKAKFFRMRGRPWVLIHPAENKVLALSAVCTHLGCIVKWDESRQQLICPCHVAAFDIEGNVVGGPAPKALAQLETSIKGDRITVKG